MLVVVLRIDAPVLRVMEAALRRRRLAGVQIGARRRVPPQVQPLLLDQVFLQAQTRHVDGDLRPAALMAHVGPVFRGNDLFERPCAVVVGVVGAWVGLVFADAHGPLTRLRVVRGRAVEIVLAHRGDVARRLRQAPVGVEGEAGLRRSLGSAGVRVLLDKVMKATVSRNKQHVVQARGSRVLLFSAQERIPSRDLCLRLVLTSGLNEAA